MKWNNLLTLPVLTLATALCCGAAQAVTTVNSGGSMLVTLDPIDETVALYSETDYHACPVTGERTFIALFVPGGSPTAYSDYCDVVHVRVAGLNGLNTVIIGVGNAGLGGFSIPGTLTVKGGSGDDTLVFGGDVSVNKLVVLLRGGDNHIRGAANNYYASTPDGLEIYPSIISNSISVATTVDIDTNNGDDKANFKALSVGGTTDINLGGGNDKSTIKGNSSFNRLFWRLGSGDNNATMRSSSCYRCQVFGGGDSDDIFLKNVAASGQVDAIGGGGDDTVKLRNVTSGSNDVNAAGGAGTDTLDNDGSATSTSGFEIILP